MNIKEALDHMAGVCYEAGERDTENGSGYWQAMKDSSVVSAEAAVLALYEKQKAVADKLAKALENELIDPCRLCDYEGMGAACEAHPNCANDRREKALAAYTKAKEGK